jgi:hypothetical protein
MSGPDQEERSPGGARGGDGGVHREVSRGATGSWLRPPVSEWLATDPSGRSVTAPIHDGLVRRPDSLNWVAVGSSGSDNTQSCDDRSVCRIRVHGAVHATGDHATTWPPTAAASRRTRPPAAARRAITGRRARNNVRDVSVMIEA